MASTRGILRFGDGPTAAPHIHFRAVREQNLEYVRRTFEVCKVGAEDWSVQNFELSKDPSIVNCQIHQTAVSMPLQRK